MDAITQLKSLIGHNFNVVSFNLYMIQNDLSTLEQTMKNCKIEETGQRFNLWRLFFRVYESTDSVFEKVEKLVKSRETYKALEAKHLKQAQDPIVVKADKPSGPLGGPLGNPLGGGAKSKQQQQSSAIDNAELRNEIRKDVERTYQEQSFFSNKRVVQILTNLLFIWSKENADISYRQGMNEIAASIIYVYFKEALSDKEVEPIQGATEQDKELLMQFNSFEHAEADIYTLFQKMMNEAQHMEMFRPNYTEAQKIKLQSKKPSAILTRVSKIQDIHLKSVDINLFRHLKLLQVEFQIFLLKWIRCMFTRELHFIESFAAWDAIFYDYYVSKYETLFLVDCIALAMIQFVKPFLMDNEDSSGCYQRLLKYPPISHLPGLVESALNIKAILLNQKTAEEIYESSQANQQQQAVYQDKQFNPVFFSNKQEASNDKTVKVQVIQKEKPQYKMKGDEGLEYQNDTSPPRDVHPSQKVYKTQFQTEDGKKEDIKKEEPLKKQTSQPNASISIPYDQAQEMLQTINDSIKQFTSLKEEYQLNLLSSPAFLETLRGLKDMKSVFESQLDAQSGRSVTETKMSVTQQGFVIRRTGDIPDPKESSSLTNKVTNFLKKW